MPLFVITECKEIYPWSNKAKMYLQVSVLSFKGYHHLQTLSITALQYI